MLMTHIYIYTQYYSFVSFHVETSYRFASCAFVVFFLFFWWQLLHMGKRKPPSWKGWFDAIEISLLLPLLRIDRNSGRAFRQRCKKKGRPRCEGLNSECWDVFTTKIPPPPPFLLRNGILSKHWRGTPAPSWPLTPPRVPQVKTPSKQDLEDQLEDQLPESI